MEPAQGSPPLSVGGEGSKGMFNYFERRPWHPCLTHQKRNPKPITLMKKHITSKNSISLGDLVASVSTYARNEREVVAAISDLFRRGDVVAKTRHGTKRLKLA